MKFSGIVQVHGFASLARRRREGQDRACRAAGVFDIIPDMKMNPSHRPCLFALAALPARSRTIDLRGNVTHTGNLGSCPQSAQTDIHVRRMMGLIIRLYHVPIAIKRNHE